MEKDLLDARFWKLHAEVKVLAREATILNLIGLVLVIAGDIFHKPLLFIPGLVALAAGWVWLHRARKRTHEAEIIEAELRGMLTIAGELKRELEEAKKEIEEDYEKRN